MPARKVHRPDNRYVRELRSLGAKAVRELTGLPAPLVSRIVKGQVKEISHETYKKFRNAHDRYIYNTLVSHNVLPKEARARRGTLAIKMATEAAKLTDTGKTFEQAVTDLDTYIVEKKGKEKNYRETAEAWEDGEATKREVEKARREYEDYDEDFEDKMDFDEERLDYFARIIVENNGFAEQWKKEGKKFLNSDRRVKTFEDAVALMKQIMAVTERDIEGWDEYIQERASPAVNWQPTTYKKTTKKEKAKKEYLQPGNPKYEEWARRTGEGKIVPLDRKYHK